MENKRWLIDVNEFRQIFWEKLQNLKFIGPFDVEHIILNTPKVDAVEVVHGRYVHKGAWHIECSECKHILVHISEAKNYCPNCGAKMDGD